MTVVIIGDVDHFEEHELVRRAVERRGADAVVVDVGDWPGDAPAEYDVDGREFVFDDRISVEDVSGVFSMLQSVFPALPVTEDWFDEKPERAAYRQLKEWQRLFRGAVGVFERHGADVTVSPAEWYWNRHRPWMLALYDDDDVPVPATTFTNDPDRVESFVETHSRAVVQGVNGGGTPELLRPADLDDERLEKLSAAPVKLQAYAPGTDTRGYVVDGEFAGMVRYEYDDDAMSFKTATDDYAAVGSTPITPDRELRETVVRAGELSPSAFAGVDVRLTDDGEFTVLESNTPGRFAMHDLAGSTDVADRLAGYLT